MSWTPEIPTGFDPCGMPCGVGRAAYSAPCNFFASDFPQPLGLQLQLELVPDHVDDSILNIGLALGCHAKVTSNIASEFDNFIHWYFVPDDRDFLPIPTVFFPKSEDKFGVLGSPFERVGRNQYTPRYTSRRIKRNRQMLGGAKLRTFDDGWDLWGFDGLHYHGNNQDFLGQSPKSKYWINGRQPNSPCPGVTRPRFALALAFDFEVMPVINEVNASLTLAMLLDEPYKVPLQLAMITTATTGSDAAFRLPLQIACVTPMVGGIDKPFMHAIQFACVTQMVGGEDKPFTLPLAISAILEMYTGAEAPLQVPLRLASVVAQAGGKDGPLMHGLQLSFVVDQAGGIDGPLSSGLKLAMFGAAHAKPFGVDEFRMQLMCEVAEVTGKEEARAVTLTLALDVPFVGGIDAPFKEPLHVAFVTESVTGIDAPFRWGIPLASVLASVVGSEAPIVSGLKLEMLATFGGGVDFVVQAPTNLAMLHTVTGSDGALVTAPLQLAMLATVGGGGGSSQVATTNPGSNTMTFNFPFVATPIVGQTITGPGIVPGTTVSMFFPPGIVIMSVMPLFGTTATFTFT